MSTYLTQLPERHTRIIANYMANELRQFEVYSPTLEAIIENSIRIWQTDSPSPPYYISPNNFELFLNNRHFGFNGQKDLTHTLLTLEKNKPYIVAAAYQFATLWLYGLETDEIKNKKIEEPYKNGFYSTGPAGLIIGYIGLKDGNEDAIRITIEKIVEYILEKYNIKREVAEEKAVYIIMKEREGLLANEKYTNVATDIVYSAIQRIFPPVNEKMKAIGYKMAATAVKRFQEMAKVRKNLDEALRDAFNLGNGYREYRELLSKNLRIANV